MATPFAIFFSSVYAMPLKALNHSDTTAWLVQSALPHFTQSNSTVIRLSEAVNVHNAGRLAYIRAGNG